MTLFLADTSAWNRSNSTDEIRERWLGLQDRGELAVCAPVSLELLYSSRGPKDHTAMKDELAGFPYLRLNELALSAARRAQDGLARRSQQKAPKRFMIWSASMARKITTRAIWLLRSSMKSQWTNTRPTMARRS